MKSQEICNHISVELQPDESVPLVFPDTEKILPGKMLHSKCDVSSFCPLLLTDSAKPRVRGAGATVCQPCAGLWLPVPSVEKGVSVSRAPNTNVAPGTQQDFLFQGPSQGSQEGPLLHSPVITAKDMAVILKRRQAGRETLLIVTPLCKMDSQMEGTGSFLSSTGQLRATDAEERGEGA